MASRGPEQGRNRWVHRGAALGATAAAFVSTSVALAAFTSTVTGGGMALSTKRICPGVRSAWPWDVRDASGGGAETNNSDALSFADTVTSTTKNWSSSFSATRFDDLDFSSGKPPGIPISSATFNFTFAPSRASDNACFYIEVRRASTNALLGTHGSSGSPLSCANLSAQVQLAYESSTAGDTTCWYFEVYSVATLIGTHGSSGTPISCNATASFVTDTVSIPELNTPTAANNVVLKIYMKNSGGRKANIDLAQLDVNYYLD